MGNTDSKMTLAAILVVSLLGLSPASASYPGALIATIPNSSTSEGQAASPLQAPPAQTSSTPAQASPDQPSADQPKPTPKPRHRKKASTNCSAAAPAPNSEGNSAQSTPCPPPKKVVRHGGSEEPAIQVTGGTSAEQAVHQRSTEQLKLATEENLKKIEALQLNPTQLDMKNQIKQFMEQSNTAATAGDLDRAHSLALKAHLLSEELVKP
jgi:hypothetical protein